MPSPLVPVPSEAKFTVAMPLTAPAAAVLTPSTMLLALVAPAASCAMLPLVVMRPSVAPPKPALSRSE